MSNNEIDKYTENGEEDYIKPEEILENNEKLLEKKISKIVFISIESILFVLFILSLTQVISGYLGIIFCSVLFLIGLVIFPVLRIKHNIKEKIKKWIIGVFLVLIIETVILIPIGLLIDEMLILIILYPLYLADIIAFDFLFWRYIQYGYKKKKEEFKGYFGEKKEVIRVSIYLVVCFWIYLAVVYILRCIDLSLYDKLYNSAVYVSLISFAVLAFIAYIIGTIHGDLKKGTLIAVVLLIIHIIFRIPYIENMMAKLFEFLIKSGDLRIGTDILVPIVIYSILGIFMTFVYYFFKQVSESKFLPLLLIYGWIFEIVRFFIDFPFYHGQITYSIILIAIMIGGIIALIAFSIDISKKGLQKVGVVNK